MSQPGLTFTGAPPVDVSASEAAVDRAVAPKTNSLLSLADSLADLNPKLRGLAGVVAAEDQKVQQAGARAAAIRTGGKNLADAVRDGTIAPTANPFFIQDYNREAAAVSAQADFDQLNIDSASWPERNDPQAFRQKYTEAIGQLSQKYTDPDQQEGFAASAAQATQQAYAANTAYNSARIVDERTANLSALSANALSTVNAKYAGKASPAQLEASLAPFKEQFFATGGNDQTWNKIVYGAYTSAAYNTQNASLLDALPANIKNLPGIADQVATDRYHIEQAIRQKTRDQVDDLRNQDYLKGRAIVTQTLSGPQGTAALTGHLDVQAFIADHINEGPQAILSALNQLQAGVADSQSLMIAKMQTFEKDPKNGTFLLDLHKQALTQGYSDDLDHTVTQLVTRGDISPEDGIKMISTAIETTRAQAGSNPFTAGAKPELFNKTVNDANATNVKAAANLRQGVLSTGSAIVKSLNQEARLVHGPGLNTGEAHQLTQLGITASSAYLAAHPGDFTGASRAGKDAMGNWMLIHHDALVTPSTPANTPGWNINGPK